MRRAVRGVFLGLALLTLLACGLHLSNSGTSPVPPPAPPLLRVATLNVHYIILGAETGPWSVGDWERRKGPMDDAFKAVGADIFGFQEMESFGRGDRSGINLTLDYLLEQNPGYAAAAVGDPALFPSTQPILYRRDRLRVVDQGWFFFSDTPEVIYSRTFDGSYPAFCSWATFEDRLTGERVTVFNVHFEYSSRSNRQMSAALVRDRIAPRIAAGENVILLGDTNARAGAETMEILEAAGLQFAPVPGSTYHFNRGLNLFGAIDHIGVSAGLGLASEPVVLRQQFRGEWPTDHYPVLVDVAVSP
jgi:endonuclease/exonuclease/phosphatase family metal-dependent hydrolase